MNIDDVTTPDIPQQGLIITTIFSQQFDLYLKYVEIERGNGFWKPDCQRGDNGLEGVPPIDDPQFQNWVKNMFWRVTEEMAEAIEPMEGRPIPGDWKRLWSVSTEIRHFFEELADALHFLAEVSVILSMNPEHIEAMWLWEADKAMRRLMRQHRVECAAASVSVACMEVIKGMGLTANCLKNKPWKNTQMPTDEAKFRRCLMSTWRSFAIMFSVFNCSLEDVYSLYFKKNTVNKFRQDTNY